MTDQGKILIVDDTPDSLKLLTEMLKSEGYEVRSAISGELALRASASNPPDLILLDIRMPEMDGYEVCRRLKAQPATRDVPVIFVSAASETEEKVLGFQVGAVDYVTKPYQREELLARVRTHLELNRLRNHLGILVTERTSKLKSNMLDFITTIASTVEMRDPYTAGHQRRVAKLATAIAREMSLPEEQIEGIHLAAVVHDLGKIQIPAEILSKPGRLSEIEFRLIQEHPKTAFEILKSIDFPWPIAQIVLQHHERLDGTGYPHNLNNRETMIEAKILAVADTVEAMASHRPYRAGLGIDAALEEISANKGKLFDPAVVEVCVKLFRERGFSFDTN